MIYSHLHREGLGVFYCHFQWEEDSHLSPLVSKKGKSNWFIVSQFPADLEGLTEGTQNLKTAPVLLAGLCQAWPNVNSFSSPMGLAQSGENMSINQAYDANKLIKTSNINNKTIPSLSVPHIILWIYWWFKFFPLMNFTYVVLMVE